MTVQRNVFNLAGKTVAVIGASGGIGTACVEGCRCAGAKVLPCGRNPEILQTLTELGLPVGVLDLEQPTGFETWASVLPALDGAVFAAGVAMVRPFSMTDSVHWEHVMRVNVQGPMLALRALLRARKLNLGASVVFVGSIAAWRGSVGYTTYSASKGALLSGVRSLALELAPMGLRANIISPGLIKTKMTEELARQQADGETRRYAQRYPLGPGAPEDVAHAAVYLLAEASRWMTGQDLIIDGGVTLT